MTFTFYIPHFTFYIKHSTLKDAAALHLQGRHFTVSIRPDAYGLDGILRYASDDILRYASYATRAITCMTFTFYIPHFTFCGLCFAVYILRFTSTPSVFHMKILYLREVMQN